MPDSGTYTFYLNPEPKVRMTRNSLWTPRAKKCLEYQEEIAWLSKQQKVPRFGTAIVGLEVTFCRKDKKLTDIDNLIKSFLDGLQYGGVFKNDNQIRSLQAEVLYGNKNPSITFSLYEL